MFRSPTTTTMARSKLLMPPSSAPLRERERPSPVQTCIPVGLLKEPLDANATKPTPSSCALDLVVVGQLGLPVGRGY